MIRQIFSPGINAKERGFHQSIAEFFLVGLA
jgi:hypothetical protein